MGKEDSPERNAAEATEDQDSSLPVPTDYRRNVWVLIVMVTVVVVAWIISLLTA